LPFILFGALVGWVWPYWALSFTHTLFSAKFVGLMIKMLTMSLIVVGTSLPCRLLMRTCVVFGGKNLHHDDIKNKIGILLS